MFTLHQIGAAYGQQITEVTGLDMSPLHNVQYIAKLIDITSINFFILFLLIVAKGWPITRRDMPFKYAFATFWILCLAADLITFYWTTLTMLAKNLADDLDNFMPMLNNSNAQITVNLTANTTSTTINATTIRPDSILNDSTTKFPTSIIDTLPKDTDQINSTPRRLSLVIRIVVMIYFLLELRTTMILEQEQKKLQFYLHFGALTMVWFVHSLIVYVISLRVEIVWQSKLILGFSSAANFLAFAVTTRLLWPKSSRSYLFRIQKRPPPGACDEADTDDNLDSIEEDENELEDDEYDGLEMRDLSSGNSNRKRDAIQSNNHEPGVVPMARDQQLQPSTGISRINVD